MAINLGLEAKNRNQRRLVHMSGQIVTGVQGPDTRGLDVFGHLAQAGLVAGHICVPMRFVEVLQRLL